MPLLADLIAAFLAGLLAYLGARWYAQSDDTPARPAEEVARAAGEAMQAHTRLRRLLVGRLDRSAATGLLLTIALVVMLVTGLVLGVLAVIVRRVASLQHLDNSVAAWGFDHRTGWSTGALRGITDLGSVYWVIAFAVVLVVVDLRRSRNRWGFLFLLTVLLGIEVLTIGLKDLVGRLRPTLDPAAARLGPSFPSGHSSTSAAFYAAGALLLGRAQRRPVRHMLIAAAAAAAVAVASSRVLLDLHWLSDVIGGLSLGWGWFALCGVAFGGRILRPTAAVDVAAGEAARARGGRRRASELRRDRLGDRGERAE